MEGCWYTRHGRSCGGAMDSTLMLPTVAAALLHCFTDSPIAKTPFLKCPSISYLRPQTILKFQQMDGIFLTDSHSHTLHTTDRSHGQRQGMRGYHRCGRSVVLSSAIMVDGDAVKRMP